MVAKITVFGWYDFIWVPLDEKTKTVGLKTQRVTHSSFLIKKSKTAGYTLFHIKLSSCCRNSSFSLILTKNQDNVHISSILSKHSCPTLTWKQQEFQQSPPRLCKMKRRSAWWPLHKKKGWQIWFSLQLRKKGKALHPTFLNTQLCYHRIHNMYMCELGG